ncbi:general substrate transporter [Neolentinus lepideus HHB14362 ss-1]|uniref:General substrate transporter n=1 Tax=Neolentinus lepideus HHB14362 ss-1 TaxID=1314782 RepID=A0A165Q0W6_9AGAM|nr:general substrate transporter [Neolentinus lepideus HHB14362 ss-1]
MNSPKNSSGLQYVESLPPASDDVLEDAPNAYPFRKSFLKLYAILFVAYLCSATNGLDANTYGGLFAVDTFTTYFGIDTNNQGLIAALYVIGNVAGCFFAGQISDTLGRRGGMILGSVVCIVGAIVQVSAQTLRALMGGRFILGMGAVIVMTAGPTYVVEMAYPKYRGVLTGCYQACFFIGTIISTWLIYGLNYVRNSPQFTWRLPLAVQGLPPLLVFIFTWFIPETPRWYVGQGKIEKAKEILIKYHGDGDPNSPIVTFEIEEMIQYISAEGSDKRWWDIRELFNSRAARYRTYLIVCIAFFGQLILPPTSYYLPLMVKTAGITDARTQLLLNALQTPIMMVAALSGLHWMDRWGRRKLLFPGSIGMSVSVAIMTACTAEQAKNPVIGLVGIAFLFVCLVIYSFTWIPAMSLYPTEVLAFATRAKGLAMLNLLCNIANIFNTYVPPPAIASAGWRFYIFYTLWDLLGAAAVYFTFVETKGRNLEEIEEIFQYRNPRKASMEKGKIAVRRDDKNTMVA